MSHCEQPAKNSRLWQIYDGMKKRCYQQGDKDYKSYGAKGIVMCDDWKHSYVKFREWAMANGYSDDLTIDRKKSELNYEPDNCQWITRFENETKNAKPITAWGETKFIWEWFTDERCRVDDKQLIRARLHRKWTPERAIGTPKMKRKSSQSGLQTETPTPTPKTDADANTTD